MPSNSLFITTDNFKYKYSCRYKFLVLVSYKDNRFEMLTESNAVPRTPPLAKQRRKWRSCVHTGKLWSESSFVTQCA